VVEEVQDDVYDGDDFNATAESSKLRHNGQAYNPIW
jgi:hypothetical protein